MPLSFFCNRLRCHAHPRFVSVVEQRTCALLILADIGKPPSAVTSNRRCRQPRPRVVMRLAPRHPAGTSVASPGRSKPRLAAPTPRTVKSAPIRRPIQPHGRGRVSPGRPLSRPSPQGASSLPTRAPDQLHPRLPPRRSPGQDASTAQSRRARLNGCSSEASGKSSPRAPKWTPSACLPTCLHPQTRCVLGPPRRLTRPPDGHEPHVAERLVPIEPIHEHDLRQPLAPRDVRRIRRLAGGPALCRTSPAESHSPGIAPPKRDDPLCRVRAGRGFTPSCSPLRHPSSPTRTPPLLEHRAGGDPTEWVPESRNELVRRVTLARDVL
jgi:hypothetical protein